MKFFCNSSELQKLVTIVEKAVPSRTTVPVLENVLMELSNGWLKVRGNDMELGIEDAIQIQNSQQDGAVLIKAKTLSTILAKLPNMSLSVEVKPNFSVLLKGEHVDFDILGLSSQEYPEFDCWNALQQCTWF